MIGILCVHQCSFLVHVRADCSPTVSCVGRLERFIYEYGWSGGLQSRLLQLRIVPGKAALGKIQRRPANDSPVDTGAGCSQILRQVSLVEQSSVFNRNHIRIDLDGGVAREQPLLAGLVSFRDGALVVLLLVEEAEDGYFVHDRLERLLHGDACTARCFQAVISFERVLVRLG